MSEEIKVVDSNSKLGAILYRNFLKSRTHYIEIGPDEVVLPGKFEKFYEQYQNFEIRDDDVFITAYLKTGSRWTQEMVWLLSNNLDFNKATEEPLFFRSPFLELDSHANELPMGFNNLNRLNELENPRCIKTHLHWSLLPKAIRTGAKQPKIIVVLRGPEDVCVSYYHQASLEGYSGSWNDFCELFLGEKVPFGSYWKHALSFWEQRHRPNIMFIKYSAMKADLFGTIRDVAAFLNKNITDEEISKMVEHLQFDNLKQNKGFNMENLFPQFKEGKVNPFIRSGKVGGHKDEMSSEMIEAFKQQTTKYLEGTGLSFD